LKLGWYLLNNLMNYYLGGLIRFSDICANDISEK
jgi:hypothetical protein